MRLGVDAVCLGAQGWSVPEIFEYAAQLGLDTVELGRKHLAGLDEVALQALRRQADELGLGIEVELGSIDQFGAVFRKEAGPAEEQLRGMIHTAQVLGSPYVQCFLGSQTERLGAMPFEQHVEEVARVVGTVKPLLRDLGMKIALENHCDFLARELKLMVEEVGSQYLGVCLDTGNPTWIGEDPLMTAEVLAPYTIMTHIRDSRVWAGPGGAMVQWAPMGQGNTDLPAIAVLLAEHAPDAAFTLEIITGSEPRSISYIGADCELWRMFPDMLARDFARYVALAQSGKAEPLNQVTAPRGTRVEPKSELGEQLRLQQLRHFEESVRYCRDVLRVGKRKG